MPASLSQRPVAPALLAALTAAAAAGLATWPMPLHPLSRALGDPGVEAVDHLWALWAGLRDGPLVIETPLLDAPQGARWVLADPVNLLWFALAAPLGPVAGFNLVQAGNLVLAGLGAALVWRWVLGGGAAGALFCAAVAPTLPVLAGGLTTGMTEAQTVGLVAVSLATAHRALERGGSWVLLAGLALGLCAWGGPYTVLYAAAAGLALGLVALLQPGPRWTRLRRGALVALVGLLLTAPVARAVLVDRDPGLPGSSALAAEVLAAPDLPKNLALSGDLLGLAWPSATAGLWPAGDPGARPATHTSYLGVVTLVLALLGVWSRRRDAGARQLVAAVLLLLVLGLGYQLQWGGRAVRLGGEPLLLPAGWLSFQVPLLGRAARWHRAHLAAGVLLAPLAAAGATWLAQRSGRWGGATVAICAALAVGDGLVAGALPWPRPTFPATAPAALLSLPGRGPLLELPLPAAGGVVTGVRNPQLLWQAQHGRLLVGHPLRAAGAAEPTMEALARGLRQAVEEGDAQRAAQLLAVAQEQGVGCVVVYPELSRWDVSAEQLVAALGVPQVRDPALLAWGCR